MDRDLAAGCNSFLYIKLALAAKARKSRSVSLQSDYHETSCNSFLRRSVPPQLEALHVDSSSTSTV